MPLLVDSMSAVCPTDPAQPRMEAPSKQIVLSNLDRERVAAPLGFDFASVLDDFEVRVLPGHRNLLARQDPFCLRDAEHHHHGIERRLREPAVHIEELRVF